MNRLKRVAATFLILALLTGTIRVLFRSPFVPVSENTVVRDNNDGTFTAVIYPKAVNHLVSGIWLPIAYAASSTFFPDANTETTSFDGWTSYDGNLQGNAGSTQANWDTGRASTTSASKDDSSTTMEIDVASDGDYHFRHGFLLFDTSALTASAVISAAEVDLWVTSKTDSVNDGSDYVALLGVASPASNTALANADHGSTGNTKQATDVDITGMTTGAYNVWTLNSTGLSNIAKTGVTKFGMREGHDIDNVRITGVNSLVMIVSTADNAGTSQDPKLVVTYTTASSSSPAIIIDISWAKPEPFRVS